jgi:hypothetical protein
MKHTHAAENYANRSHNKIETIFTKFIGATNFNFIAILILILKLRQAVQWTV